MGRIKLFYNFKTVSMGRFTLLQFLTWILNFYNGPCSMPCAQQFLRSCLAPHTENTPLIVMKNYGQTKPADRSSRTVLPTVNQYRTVSTDFSKKFQISNTV